MDREKKDREEEEDVIMRPNTFRVEGYSAKNTIENTWSRKSLKYWYPEIFATLKNVSPPFSFSLFWKCYNCPKANSLS